MNVHKKVLLGIMVSFCIQAGIVFPRNSTTSKINQKLLTTIGTKKPVYINTKKIKQLIQDGADINCQDKDGFTPLNRTVFELLDYYNKLSKPPRDDLLCDHTHNDPYVSHFTQNSFLRKNVYPTIYAQYKEAIKILLQHAADPNIPNNQGETPFLIATKLHSNTIHMFLYRNPDIRYILLDYKANPLKADNNEITPLIIESTKPYNSSFLQILCDKGANPNKQDTLGRTALVHAAQQDNHYAIQTLLKNNANPNIQDCNRDTALMHAAAWYNYATIWLEMIPPQPGGEVKIEGKSLKILLEWGASPNIQNNEGETALMYAASRNNRNSIKTLIKWGADVMIKDYQDKTAIDYTSDPEIIKLLQKYGITKQ